MVIKLVTVFLMMFFAIFLAGQTSVPSLTNNENDCKNLKVRVRQHMDLGRLLLQKEEIGSFRKRSRLSSYQFEKSIDLLKVKIKLKCNHPHFIHLDKFEIVDALIELSRFGAAREQLFSITKEKEDEGLAYMPYAYMLN